MSNTISLNKNRYQSLIRELIDLRQKVALLEKTHCSTVIKIERLLSQRKLYAGDRLLHGIAQATNCLLTIEDYDLSINSALAALGNAVAVDRIYIFNNHYHKISGKLLMSQRWEWVGNGVSAQIDHLELQNLAYDDFCPRWDDLSQGIPISGSVKDFPEYERKILHSQGILSLMIIPIQIKGQFWGFIGFADCQRDRQWSTNERSILQVAVGNLGGAIAQHETEIELRSQQ